MSECTQRSENLKDCNCTYDCAKKGHCCACLAYHRDLNQFPACYFSARAEKTYDRSFTALVQDRES